MGLGKKYSSGVQGSPLLFRWRTVWGVGVCQRMVGVYSNAVEGQLGEVPVLATIFPNVCLMGRAT
jgi:hypothetical protein